jgi:hypothetical protein
MLSFRNLFLPIMLRLDQLFRSNMPGGEPRRDKELAEQDGLAPLARPVVIIQGQAEVIRIGEVLEQGQIIAQHGSVVGNINKIILLGRFIV